MSIKLRTVALATAAAVLVQATVGSILAPSAYAAGTPPVLTASGGTAVYVHLASPINPVAVDPDIALANDDADVVEATVQIAGGMHSGDRLFAQWTPGSTYAIYDPGTYTLTMKKSTTNGTFTVAEMQNMLRSVAFYTDVLRVESSARTISFTVADGDGEGNTVSRTVNVQTQPPIVTTSGGTTAFVNANNADAVPVVVDSGITVSDPDSATLASATVAIAGNYFRPQDVLAFTNDGTSMGDIAQESYDGTTGTLELRSAAGATLAQWQSALRAVTYTNVAVTPVTANRTISFSVHDGGMPSNSATKIVSVSAVYQTPVLKSSGSLPEFTIGGTAVVIDDGIEVTDRDSDILASATVRISDGFQIGDMLLFINAGSIVGSYDGTTGVLTLTASGGAPIVAWQSALRSVLFAANASEHSPRTVTFSVSDGSSSSSPVAKTVAIRSKPVLTASQSPTSFESGDNEASVPVAADPGIGLTTYGYHPLTGGSVRIANPEPGDRLDFANDGSTMGDIAGSYENGELTLTSSGGTATSAQWQAALRAVRYTNTEIKPVAGNRTIRFEVTDGMLASDPALKTIAVTATPQTPILAAGGGASAFKQGGSPVAVDSGLTVSDRDSATLTKAIVTITGNFQAGEDVLAFANDGTTMGNIEGSYNAGTGTLTLTSDAADGLATLAQWQAALRSIAYGNTSDTPRPSARVVSFTVDDGTKSSTPVSTSVSLVTVDALTPSAASLSLAPGSSGTVSVEAAYTDGSHADVTAFATWTVSQASVATAVAGTITAAAPGNAVVTATYGGKSANIDVRVAANPVYVFPSDPPKEEKPKEEKPNGPSEVFQSIVSLEKLIAKLREALDANHAADFADAGSHWAAADIVLAAKLGIVKGYPNGGFRPNVSVSRAEFGAMIANAFGLEPGAGNAAFADMQGHWAARQIGILASNGVIGGYEDGTFRADRSITRAELVSIVLKLVRMQQPEAGAASPFEDVEAGFWAKGLIEAAAAGGIVEGRDAGHFAPNAEVTRAEAITVILRALRADPTIASLLKP